jgi:hypothetical protein
LPTRWSLHSIVLVWEKRTLRSSSSRNHGTPFSAFGEVVRGYGSGYDLSRRGRSGPPDGRARGAKDAPGRVGVVKNAAAPVLGPLAARHSRCQRAMPTRALPPARGVPGPRVVRERETIREVKRHRHGPGVLVRALSPAASDPAQRRQVIPTEATLPQSHQRRNQ